MPEQIAKRLGSNEEELLSALTASTADAVYAVDDAGVVLFANPGRRIPAGPPLGARAPALRVVPAPMSLPSPRGHMR